jgi:hypothetical protein
MTVRVEIVGINWPHSCLLCGDQDAGHFAILPDDVWVCELCTTYPYDDRDYFSLDERLEHRAAELERLAAKARALIGKKLKLPSHAEFRAALAAVQAEQRAADEWADAHFHEAEEAA